MSYRRSLSFAESEEELLRYFDENGKSDIAKEALQFYKDNKDKIIYDDVLKVLKLLNINLGNNKTQHEPQRDNLKLSKLVK